MADPAHPRRSRASRRVGDRHRRGRRSTDGCARRRRRSGDRGRTASGAARCVTGALRVLAGAGRPCRRDDAGSSTPPVPGAGESAVFDSRGPAAPVVPLEHVRRATSSCPRTAWRRPSGAGIARSSYAAVSTSRAARSVLRRTATRPFSSSAAARADADTSWRRMRDLNPRGVSPNPLSKRAP